MSTDEDITSDSDIDASQYVQNEVDMESTQDENQDENQDNTTWVSTSENITRITI